MKILTGKIHGVERCDPLAGARISYRDEQDALLVTGRSRSQGRWRITVPDEARVLCFEASGFVTKRYAVADVPVLVRLLEDRLIGYVERLWFTPGEKAVVYAHVPHDCRLSLCRYGDKVENVLEPVELPAMAQQTPDGLFVDRGLCWRPSAEIVIPQAARPGLYSWRLESADEVYDVPFVVSTPLKTRGQNPLLVLVSTTTWQSYNLWGGRSRYRNFEEGPDAQFVKWTLLKDLLKRLLPRKLIQFMVRQLSEPTWMFKRLSIQRPFPYTGLKGDSPDVLFGNHLAGGEWRTLAWLERMGYV